MNNKYLSILACLFLLIGCSGNDNFSEPKVSEEVKSFTTFTATLPDKPETRAYLTSADESKKSVYWEKGDAIYVYSDEDQDLHLYKLISIGDDNTATFGGTAIKGNTFYALYQPTKSPQPEVNGRIVYFSNVLGVATGFGDNPRYDFNGIMVASSQDNSFRFKQTLGILNFRICGIHEFSGINFIGNKREVINGPGYINLSEERPIYRLDDSANSWYYSCIFYNKIVDDNTFNFCLIIPPTTFENGFTITFIGHDKDGKELQLEKSINRKVDVGVATITSYSLVDINAELKELETIHFEDSEVKAIRVANWDTDGDGVLTYTEAAAGKDIGTVFKDNNITSFKELQYFTGLEEIPNQAFENCYHLQEIMLPPNITRIGNRAFSCCYLHSFVIPDGVTTIGSEAFDGVGTIDKLVIPNSVISIGERALHGCIIDSLEIGAGITSGLDHWMFESSLISHVSVATDNPTYDSRENCNAIIDSSTNTLIFGTENTTFPNTIISIGTHAFIDNQRLVRDSLVLPDGIQSIGSYAFAGCINIKSVSFGSGLDTIGEYAFNSFSDSPYLETITCNAITPPTIKSNNSESLTWNPKYPTEKLFSISWLDCSAIYVPAESVVAYKAADGWSAYSDRILSIGGDNNNGDPIVSGTDPGKIN